MAEEKFTRDDDNHVTCNGCASSLGFASTLERARELEREHRPTCLAVVGVPPEPEPAEPAPLEPTPE